MARGFRLSAFALLVALGALAVGIAVTRASANAVLAADEVTIDCTTNAAEFGEVIECASNANGAGYELVWSDGHTSALDEFGVLIDRHAPVAVGVVEVAVVDHDGLSITSTEVTITPDLQVACETGKTKDIYELAPSNTADDGWDYVYLHPDTGARVLPGNPDHPVDPGLTSWEAIVVGSAEATGECVASSDAAELFDGSFQFTMGTEWGENTVPFDRLTPWSKSHWLGTQPGFIDVTVSVNDQSASERQDVYLSGCT